MIPSDLEAVLSGWDEAVRGRKPHLMYTIPCGQNPTGSVMPSERYDEIYAICHKHDVIIMEDDPYFGGSKSNTTRNQANSQPCNSRRTSRISK
jgi:aromatic amino acid aminotransferase I